MKEVSIDLDVLMYLCESNPYKFRKNEKKDRFEKKCSRCKRWKDILTMYHKRADTTDGLAYTCKHCAKRTAKESYDRRQQGGK